jgi:protein-L-isoaspartate(D-aspartate) O-methyltransferase
VPLAERSRVTLARMGVENINVLAHDGTSGVADYAPFDAIMVTACAPELPRQLVGQLRDGGRLLIPVVRGRDQVLYRYRRRGAEMTIEESVSCRFVPLLPGVAKEDAQRA